MLPEYTLFLNKPSVLLCDHSGFTDPTIVLQWEKWDQMDYTWRNLVGPVPVAPEVLQIQEFYFDLHLKPLN